MHPVRKQRLIIVLLIVACTSAAAALLFYALSENMNFFYAPADVKAGEAPMGKTIRVGGLVVVGSVHRAEDALDVRFDITDNAESMTVHYSGILPDLFSEGQGIVALGTLQEGQHFVATQVLAKHDENYMPPEVHDALKKGADLSGQTTDLSDQKSDVSNQKTNQP